MNNLAFNLSVHCLKITLKRDVTLNAYTKFNALFPTVFTKAGLFRKGKLVLLLKMYVALSNVTVVKCTNDLHTGGVDRRRGHTTMGSFTLAGKLLMTLLTNIVDTYFTLKLSTKAPVGRTTLTKNMRKLCTKLPMVFLMALKNFLAGTICYLRRGVTGGAVDSCTGDGM